MRGQREARHRRSRDRSVSVLRRDGLLGDFRLAVANLAFDDRTEHGGLPCAEVDVFPPETECLADPEASGGADDAHRPLPGRKVWGPADL
jgi:hypothetical protein